MLRALGRVSGRPPVCGTPSTRTIGASPAGATASIRAPFGQRRSNSPRSAIASLASGIPVSAWTVVRAVAEHAGPAGGVRDEVDPCAPGQAAALVVPGGRLHDDVPLVLGQAAQLLLDDGGLPRALRGQGDVRELAAPDTAGAGLRPGGRHAVRRGLEDLDRVRPPEGGVGGGLGQPDPDALAGQRVPDEHDPAASRPACRPGGPAGCARPVAVAGDLVVEPGDAVAAVGDRPDGELHDAAVRLPGARRSDGAGVARAATVRRHPVPYPARCPRAPSAPRTRRAARAPTPPRRRA